MSDFAYLYIKHFGNLLNPTSIVINLNALQESDQGAQIMSELEKVIVKINNCTIKGQRTSFTSYI